MVTLAPWIGPLRALATLYYRRGCLARLAAQVPKTHLELIPFHDLFTLGDRRFGSITAGGGSLNVNV